MLTLSWWSYFLIISIGAGALALALIIIFCKQEGVLFSSEVDAEFNLMAQSAQIVHLQHLADQWAQEIAHTSYTTPKVGPPLSHNQSPLLSPTHISTHHPNRPKCQGHIFTPINFNLGNSSQHHIPHPSGYTIPPVPTYPAPMPLCPNSPTLGKYHDMSTLYLQLPGLHSELSQSMITSKATTTSQVTTQVMFLVQLTGDSQVFKLGGQWWDSAGFWYGTIG